MNSHHQQFTSAFHDCFSCLDILSDIFTSRCMNFGIKLTQPHIIHISLPTFCLFIITSTSSVLTFAIFTQSSSDFLTTDPNHLSLPWLATRSIGSITRFSNYSDDILSLSSTFIDNVLLL